MLKDRVAFVLIERGGRQAADVDEHAFVGEIGQQAAAIGDSGAGVEGDRFPHPVNVGFGDAVIPEHSRSQIGSLDLEASLTLGVIAESQIVHHSGGEEQLLVVGGIVQAALVFGEQARKQKASDAVIDDRLTRRRPHDRTTARLASASGPAGRVRMSSMPPR